ncbi:MAG: DeoR/GlpR family DNA-binding transcription regulator [Pseudomonadota bacterium]
MAERFRHAEILELARSEGQVSVDDLARRFRISVQTVRKDLAELSEQGALTRVHGGALLPRRLSNIAYEERRALKAEAKTQIAAACAAHVPENATVFLNIGTTTEAVARALLSHRDLMVVTNNLNIANILAANPNCNVLVTGGLLRRSDGGLMGTMTTQVIANFKFDLAVIGCSALDKDGDILDFDIEEVGVSQTIIRQSRHVILAADSSKFDRTAPVRIGNLRDVNRFITDGPLPGDLARQLEQSGTVVELG